MKNIGSALLASALIALLLWVVFLFQFLSYGEGLIGMIACLAWVLISYKIWERLGK